MYIIWLRKVTKTEQICSLFVINHICVAVWRAHCFLSGSETGLKPVNGYGFMLFPKCFTFTGSEEIYKIWPLSCNFLKSFLLVFAVFKSLDPDPYSEYGS